MASVASLTKKPAKDGKAAAPRALVQKKLDVGAANDRFEREADRAAQRMSSPSSAASPPPMISGLRAQRQAAPKPGPEAKKRDGETKPPEKRAQRKGKESRTEVTPKKPRAQRKTAAAASPRKEPKTAQHKAAALPPKKQPATKAKAQRKTSASPSKKDASPKPKAQRKATAPPTAPEQKKRQPAKAPEKRGQRNAATAPPKPKKPAPQPARAQRAPKPSAAAAEPVSQAGGTAPDHVEASIDKMRRGHAGGLDPALKSRVEAAVGSDLGGVRVHRDRKAGEAASALGAKAFTVGQDMFFGHGQFNPGTSAGRALIAHEAAHTVQQRGGSSLARRIQRAGGKTKKDGDGKAAEPLATTKLLEEKDQWKVDATPDGTASGTITVPKLELPRIAGKLKGEANPVNGPAANKGIELPVEGSPFTRMPQAPRETREDSAAYEKWVAEMKKSAKDVKGLLETQLKGQKDAAPLSNPGGADVYVLRRAKQAGGNKGGKGGKGGGDYLGVLLIGTTEELAGSDGVLRPMIGHAGQKAGDYVPYDADHILEDQLGGLDSAENMWLLDRSYNRSVGPKIASRITDSLKDVTKKAEAKAKKIRETDKVEFDGKIPDVEHIKQEWKIVFAKVAEGKAFGSTENWWSRSDIQTGKQLPQFKALSEIELVEQGFKFDANTKPKRINVFPTREGGRPFSFSVSPDGKSVKLENEFFMGMTLTGAPDYKPLTGNAGQLLMKLPVRYGKKKDKDKKNSPLVYAEGDIVVQHEPRFGFGGYVTRESIVAFFKDAKFGPLSPLSFPNAGLTPEGELSAAGHIAAAKAIFPKLDVPLMLRGEDILIDFPVPAKQIALGPLKVTDPALSLGVGGKGFFIEGSVGVAIDGVGSGTITARGENDGVTVEGDFNLELDFLDKQNLHVKYSLGDDRFTAQGQFSVKKNALPGVDGGGLTVTVSNEAFSIVGDIQLGGPLKGSTLTAGYATDTGLVIEGKDLPLPVGKLPGVTGAAVTVKAVRDPGTAAWSITGGGKAALEAGGAKGELGILFDGTAITFNGRVDVAKGPAKGWLQVGGTNLPLDAEGKPKEGGKPGDFHIWGNGEATIAFGKVLTGTVGIEYTPLGAIILSGEIALPPTYDLFPKKDLSPKEPLFKTPEIDFPIWGIELGPIDVGVFAFVDAKITAEAWIGPGQLRDTKLHATIDLDKPEDAVVDGHAQFYVPAFAGLTLDLGGGLKASAAIAYVKGRVGLYGELGLAAAGSFDVNVHWAQPDGLGVAALAQIKAQPKFEVGVEASVTAGADLGLFDIEKTWGPWKKPLGSFGPAMELGASMPIKWSEKDGLQVEAPTFDPPKIDAKAMMQSGFDTLV